MEFLTQSIESHDRLLGEITGKLNRNAEAISQLIAVTNQDAIHIRALVRIVEMHERRLTDLEGDGGQS